MIMRTKIHPASRIVRSICKALLWNTYAELIFKIVKCPCNKIKNLWWASPALQKSFQLIYSNTHLNSRETVPLNCKSYLTTNVKVLHKRHKWNLSENSTLNCNALHCAYYKKLTYKYITGTVASDFQILRISSRIDSHYRSLIKRTVAWDFRRLVF